MVEVVLQISTAPGRSIPAELPLQDLIQTAETEDLGTVVGKIYAKTDETDANRRAVYTEQRWAIRSISRPTTYSVLSSAMIRRPAKATPSWRLCLGMERNEGLRVMQSPWWARYCRTIRRRMHDSYRSFLAVVPTARIDQHDLATSLLTSTPQGRRSEWEGGAALR